MKLIVKLFLVSCFMLIVLSFCYRNTETDPIKPATEFFKTHSKLFAGTAFELDAAIRLIDNTKPETIANAKKALKNCRIRYKQIEFFLAYFFPQASLVYNAPAKYELEEPGLEFREPVGLQVMEALLFDKDIEANRSLMLKQSEVIFTSADDLNSLLYNFRADKSQLLESIRLELIRIIALNITGYDAPLLKSGIPESAASLSSIEYCLAPFSNNTNQFDSLSYYLKGCLSFLRKPSDFDSFDRLTFLTEYALPFQQCLSEFIKHSNFQSNSTKALNYDAPNLFSNTALNLNSFTQNAGTATNEILELGKQLFSEKALSGNNKISCQTCHQPEKHFSDGLKKSIGSDEHSTGKRNAPTLLYAAFQYSQFWDGRVKSLEEQIKFVIKNPAEMNADYDIIIKKLQDNKEYNELFKTAFNTDVAPGISINNIAISIAAYIRTLNPMNSAFDRYIGGDKTALSQQQKDGYNLFMGKAQCGTCHFAPLFNGLIPPLYNRTEVEVLGTPDTDDFIKVQADKDQGRYDVFPAEFYLGAFKTPTVRNAAVTAPYMHNGAFSTLEKVIEFYNKGGGVGLGLKINNQTLSPAQLKLNEKEVKKIVRFLESLTDSLYISKQVSKTLKVN